MYNFASENPTYVRTIHKTRNTVRELSSHQKHILGEQIKRYLFLCLTLIGWGLSGHATPFVAKEFILNDHEEVQGKITDFLQNHDGLIWFSSFNGLHCYDGYHIVKYKSYPLVSNRIQQIYRNSEGNIWCLSAQKVYLFMTKENRFIDVQQAFEKNGPTNVTISNIFPLDNGVTWMVSERGECFRFIDNDPLNSCERMNYLFERESDINIITLDNSGQEWIISQKGLFIHGHDKAISHIPFHFFAERGKETWFASTSGKMACYNPEKQTLSNICLPKHIRRIHSQISVNDSLLYLSTDKGIVFVNLDTRKSRILHPIELNSIYHDLNGNIWGGTPDFQICRISPQGEMLRIPMPEDAYFNHFRIYFEEDKQGLLWLTFHDNSDILYFDAEEQQFRRPNNAEPIYRDISGHFIDNQNNHWFRLESNLIKTSLHNSSFTIHNPENDAEVRSISTDKQGRIWLGFRNECIRISGPQNAVGYLDKNGRIVKEKTSCGILAYNILHDSQGRVWIGCKKSGLYLLEPTADSTRYQISHYGHSPEDPNSLRENQVYYISEDSRGHIWIGTLGGGLHLWDNGQFIHSGNGLGILSEEKPQNVRFISELENGIVGVCAKEGFFTFSANFTEPSQIHFFQNTRTHAPHSLSENDVMSAYQCQNGDIYLCTVSGGLNLITSDTLLSANIRFKHIGQEDGLASDAVFSMIEDSNHDLWLASNNTLTRILRKTQETEIYDMSHFGVKQKFSEAIPISVNQNLVFGTTTGLIRFSPKHVIPNQEKLPLVFTGLEIQNRPSFERIGEDRTLELKADERNITIKFAALDYKNGNLRIRYAYKIDGIDKTWNHTDKSSITYLNLPKGEHLFRIYSTNSNGTWIDNQQTLRIKVAPRFFESNWGYLTMVLTVGLVMLVIFFLYRRFYLLRHKLSVEKEMTNIKLRFFTDISHELRTPLTLIDGPVTEMLQDPTISQQNRFYLELVEKNTKRMLSLVNQILDFRKLQNKKMELVVEPILVSSQLQRIMENFMALANQHNITFELKESDVEWAQSMWIDQDKFEKIFFNLISNAFKYTPDGKSITLFIKHTPENVQISVKDEGIGISQEHLNDLFTRFKTIVKSNLFKPSSGIGLSLVKQFVELHHGTIEVISQLHEGCCFTVTFLAGRKHFANEPVEYICNDNCNDASTEQPTPPTSATNQEKTEVTEATNMDTSDTEEARPTILVVEDNDDVRSFIHAILNKDYTVIEATNGEEGIKIGKECWPDLIISDVMMPVMDGYAMLERIKQDCDLYAIPVILLTAKTAIDNQIQGTQLGADDYITKPFNAGYLKVKVAALIEQRKLLKCRIMESLFPQDCLPTSATTEKRHLQLQPLMPEITPADETFIEQVMQIVEKHMDDSSFNLPAFASALNMGRTTFTNKFKAVLGLSPMDFVIDMRMKRAEQLLRSQQFNIAEIAYRTGFNNPKYFSTCFKKHYGQRPTDVMKQDAQNPLNQAGFNT